MSGPIVRKYGFPNHEQIFGRKPLEHGADEPKSADEKPAETSNKPQSQGGAKADAGQRGA